MRSLGYKKDILFYLLIFVLSASLYFFIVNIIKQNRSIANQKFSGEISKKLKTDISILSLKNINDTTCSLNSFLSKRNGKNVAVVLIDGGCSVCIQTLFNWKSFIEKNNIGKERVIFIGYDASLKQLNYSMKKIVNLDCTMFIDNSYLLGTLNKIGKDSDLKTFIIDKKQKILVQNDPFIDIKIKQQFIKLLKE